MLASENDENMVRKDFTPSEAVAIAEAMRERVEAAARERQLSTLAQNAEDRGANLAQREESGRTREVLASRVGMSEKTYDKARKVVEAAISPPRSRGSGGEAGGARRTGLSVCTLR